MVGNVRWKNPEEMAAYRTCVEKQAAVDKGGMPDTGETQTDKTTREWFAEMEGFAECLRRSGRQELQILSESEQMEEFMFLGLRLMEGVSEAVFRETFGVSVDEVYGETVKRLVEQGLLVRVDGRLFLTPLGIDVSNVVFAAFLL